MKTTLILAIALGVFGGATLAQTGVPGAHFIENWDRDGDGVVTTGDFGRG